MPDLDFTPELNRLATEAAQSSNRTLFLPPGNLHLKTQPDPLPDIRIEGAGMLRTVLVRDYNGSDGYGVLHFTKSGFELRRLAINAAAGTSRGSAISVIASPDRGVDGWVMEDLYISTWATDGWNCAVNIDGTAKDTGARGNRINAMRNIHVFGASWCSVRMAGVVGLSWHGGGLYTAGGTGTTSLMVAGVPQCQSWYLDLSLSNINGAVNLSQCKSVSLRASQIGDVQNDSSAEDVAIIAKTGTVQGNWVRSGVIQV